MGSLWFASEDMQNNKKVLLAAARASNMIVLEMMARIPTQITTTCTPRNVWAVAGVFVPRMPWDIRFTTVGQDHILSMACLLILSDIQQGIITKCFSKKIMLGVIFVVIALVLQGCSDFSDGTDTTPCLE